jgi:hypothetical protein
LGGLPGWKDGPVQLRHFGFHLPLLSDVIIDDHQAWLAADSGFLGGQEANPITTVFMADLSLQSVMNPSILPELSNGSFPLIQVNPKFIPLGVLPISSDIGYSQSV